MDSADSYIRAINEKLRQEGLPPYVEANEPDVYDGSFFGRSALDHDSARLISRVATLAARQQPTPHFSLLADNCYRVAFVPCDFSTPLLTDFSEELFGDDTCIWVGSSAALLREVRSTSELFGVPLEGGVLADSTAERINAYHPLFPGDVVDPNSDLRTTWLLLHEGARLSVLHHIALSLAG